MNKEANYLIAPREELAPADIEAMFHLLADHFDGVTRTQFNRDLEEKNWVVLLRREARLIGFSTLHAYESRFEGEPVRVIYSGDTIVAPEAWSSSLLARGWITAVRQLQARHPRRKHYWLLLTSGFRTYRFLPVFWREFLPHPHGHFPAAHQTLRDQLAGERFGERFDQRTGVVKLEQPQRLRGPLGAIPAGRDRDPFISFFLERNPGHGSGDELVCLTELSDDNLTAAGRRMVGLRKGSLVASQPNPHEAPSS